jgi:hypothetical protein
MAMARSLIAGSPDETPGRPMSHGGGLRGLLGFARVRGRSPLGGVSVYRFAARTCRVDGWSSRSGQLKTRNLAISLILSLTRLNADRAESLMAETVNTVLDLTVLWLKQGKLNLLSKKSYFIQINLPREVNGCDD